MLAGSVNTARLPDLIQPGVLTVIEHIHRRQPTGAGSAVIATNTRSNRSISASMLAASNTSVRNSTVPPIPAGSPASVQRSASENTRSIRAVWVSTGSGVTCTSPKASPAAGSLSCPGRFCQANITWTSG